MHYGILYYFRDPKSVSHRVDLLLRRQKGYRQGDISARHYLTQINKPIPNGYCFPPLIGDFLNIVNGIKAVYANTKRFVWHFMFRLYMFDDPVSGLTGPLILFIRLSNRVPASNMAADYRVLHPVSTRVITLDIVIDTDGG